MASFPKEHNNLYFDALIRTQKKESVLAFIMATYYAKKNNSVDKVKEDIYKRLEYAYGLFRDNVRTYDNGVGSYSGTDSQFSSQYTLGLELGIWKNSDLDLNDLALKVAKNQITVTDYFDRVMLNYVQPVSGVNIHPLYSILKYMKKNNKNSIHKSEFGIALELPNTDCSEAINALYNILIGTSYFIDENNTLTLDSNIKIDDLLSKCNKKYIGVSGYEKSKEDLVNNDEAYINYLISENNELEVYYKEQFKQWLIDTDRYSEATINNYIYYVSYIQKKGFSSIDLYTTNDLMYIDKILSKFKSDESYIAFNDNNNGSPNASLTQYRLFIESLKKDSKKGGYNTIYYGIPGSGKSFIANSEALKITNNDLIVRTTFYPDYTNSDFIGQIIPKIDDNDKNSVMYDIQGGPFTDALVKAFDNPSEFVCLIIEEINRGNAAAIFGDLFQLLDRDDDGKSSYEIKNYTITKYLEKNCKNKNVDFSKIYIPTNLIILGTMNTSDQNVFTLDTAFKRRWNMKHIINDIDNSKYANMIIPILNVSWKDFVKEINYLITHNDVDLGINGEDKQLGSYFISGQEWGKIDTLIKTNNSEEAARIFAEKILSYIWEDVAKIDKKSIFKKDYKTFDEVVKDFLIDGDVFDINLERE